MKRLRLVRGGAGVDGGGFMPATRFASRGGVRGVGDGTRAAWADDRRCWSGPCETLWVGAVAANATKVATLEGPSATATKSCGPGMAPGRVPHRRRRAALLRCLGSLRARRAASRSSSRRPARTNRSSRGMTFSENGRAITFDECPRGPVGVSCRDSPPCRGERVSGYCARDSPRCRLPRDARASRLAGRRATCRAPSARR